MTAPRQVFGISANDKATADPYASVCLHINALLSLQPKLFVVVNALLVALLAELPPMWPGHSSSDSFNECLPYCFLVLCE